MTISPWRITFVFTFFILLFIGIGSRLVFWQIISADKLQEDAAKQHFISLSIPASRGEIRDSEGAALVVNAPAYLVYAEPRTVKDPLEFATKVGPLVNRDPVELQAALSEPNRVWLPLVHKAPTDKVDVLKALNLSGLGFEKEPTRFYPEASMAAHILGFVGSDVNGNDQGYFGLEGFYDRQLKGVDGSLRIEKDAHGNPLLIGAEERIEPQDGRTLVLHMDKSIQEIVERQLAVGIQKYGAKAGNVTILDPQTGGVLAMASYPDYNPGLFSQFDRSLYKNPIVADFYEPGSTFKTLVMAEGLEEKLVTPSTTLNEDGPVKVGPYFIRTWNNQYNGVITMTQVLEHSSNVGMVFVARKLGKEKLIDFIKRAGVGKSTNIDLEDESSPELRPDDEWHEIDELTASFGQGIAVTPIQMVRAVAALANDGKMMEPHMVKEIKDYKGETIPIKPKVVTELVSPATARVITEMMVAAVDNGEAKFAKPKGYRIAGKTGTAQIPVEGHYDSSKTIASFVGFAPADKPRFVMLVTLREPTSSPWGSETAAPLFFAIARELFMYWGIPPQ